MACTVFANIGLYTGAVYVTPVFGGWVADRWLGRRNAVVSGHCDECRPLAMAFDASFLLALVLLIVGCGFLKGTFPPKWGHCIHPTMAQDRLRFSPFFPSAAMSAPSSGVSVWRDCAAIWMARRLRSRRHLMLIAWPHLWRAIANSRVPYAQQDC